MDEDVSRNGLSVNNVQCQCLLDGLPANLADLELRSSRDRAGESRRALGRFCRWHYSTEVSVPWYPCNWDWPPAREESWQPRDYFFRQHDASLSNPPSSDNPKGLRHSPGRLSPLRASLKSSPTSMVSLFKPHSIYYL